MKFKNRLAYLKLRSEVKYYIPYVSAHAFVLKLYTSKRVSLLSTLEILFINIDKFPAGPQRRVAAKNIQAGNEIVSFVVFNLKNPTTKDGETVAPYRK
jgi:hypothetical protein